MKKIIGLILCLILCVGCLSFVGCKEEQENGSTNVSDQKVVMVGDSLYAYWKDTCATDLGLSNVTNLASSGSSALYWSKSNIIERVAKQNPDIILVCLGTNDVIDLNRRGDCAAKGGNDGYEFSLQSVLKILYFSVLLPVFGEKALELLLSFMFTLLFVAKTEDFLAEDRLKWQIEWQRDLNLLVVNCISDTRLLR